MLRRLLSTALYALFALLALAPLQALALERLRVLAWPGYADPDLVHAFEQRFGVSVEVSLVSSDDALWEKVNANGGRNFDVVAANTAEIRRYVEHKLLAPILPGRLPNTARQLPRFRALEEIPGLSQDGQVYAIPYTYATMGLIYDRKQLPSAPESWAVLWAPELKGKVLAFDGSSHNFSLAALRRGHAPFKIGAEAFPLLTRDLIDLRRNVLTFYTSPEESVRLFRQYGVAVMFANYGSQQLKQLRDAGADVGYAIPREGTLAWLDCWAIGRQAGNPTLAEAWINFMLEPAASNALTQRQGLANTTQPNSATRDRDHIYWLAPVEDTALRTALWSRILSGDKPQQFARKSAGEAP